MWVGNVMLVVLNLPMIGIWVKLLTVPYRYLFPAILLFCCIGVYTLNNSTLRRLHDGAVRLLRLHVQQAELEPAPLLLGFILGPMMEENLRRALLLSRGDWSTFVDAAALVGPADRGRAADRHRHAADDPAEARSRVQGRDDPRRISRSRKRAITRAMTILRLAAGYPSTRLPVFARNVVSTSHPLAAQAGLRDARSRAATPSTRRSRRRR